MQIILLGFLSKLGKAEIIEIPTMFLLKRLEATVEFIRDTDKSNWRLAVWYLH